MKISLFKFSFLLAVIMAGVVVLSGAHKAYACPVGGFTPSLSADQNTVSVSSEFYDCNNPAYPVTATINLYDTNNNYGSYSATVSGPGTIISHTFNTSSLGNGTYTIRIDAKKGTTQYDNITHTFTINNRYTVTATANTGGSITSTSTKTVSANSTAGFTVAPSSGYIINPNKVTGSCSFGNFSNTDYTTSNTYTTGPIKSDCNVTFNFTYTAAPVAPTVTTTSCSSITQTSAVSGGNVTSNGGATVTVSGIAWSTTANPTTANTKTTNGWAIGGPWTSNLTGLTASTLYYIRAYATNSVGTAYGGDVTCATSALAPSGTLSGDDCKITVPNTRTCTTTLTLTIANPVSGAQTNITKSIPELNTEVATGITPAAKQNIVVGFPGNTFFLNHNTKTLTSKTINATCDASLGLTWDNNSVSCISTGGGTPPVTPPPSTTITGTLTPSNPSCFITLGNSSCEVTLDWHAYNVDYGEISVSPAARLGSSSNLPLSGSNSTFVVPYTGTTTTYNFELWRTIVISGSDNNNKLATSTATATCDTSLGLTWDTTLGKCIKGVTPPPTPTDSAPTCGVSHYTCDKGTNLAGDKTGGNNVAGSNGLWWRWKCDGTGSYSGQQVSCAEDHSCDTGRGPSGKLTPNPASCPILEGQSTCPATLHWQVFTGACDNRVKPNSSIQATGVDSVAISTPDHSTNSGVKSLNVPYTGSSYTPTSSGPRTYSLYNDIIRLSSRVLVPRDPETGYQSNSYNTIYAQSVITATCDTGTTWNGSICAAPKPDLTASAPAQNTAVAGKAQTFTSTISNIGNASTGASFYNAFQISTTANGGNPINRTSTSPFQMSPLGAGATATATATTTANYTFDPAGTWSVRFCADDSPVSSFRNRIAESNENNNCSSPWTDVTVTAATPPSCTNISATDCGIPGGESTCDTILNWGTQHLTSGDTAVTRNNPNNSHVAPPISPTTSGTNIRNTVNYGLTGQSTFFIYHNIDGTPTKLCQATMTARCDSGSIWNVTRCNPIPGLSGTLHPTVRTNTSCDIPEGQNSCKINFTWETLGTVEGGTISGVRSNVNDSGIPASDFHVSDPDVNSGSQDFIIPYDIRTFYLYNTNQLAESRVTSKCISGTAWNGINKCVTIPPLCGNSRIEGSETCDNGPGNGTCPNTCSALCTLNSCPPPGGGCSNGATNYPTCTFPPGVCPNGATNPPTCTLNPGDGCVNGATNPPECTLGGCLNGATNPPACTTNGSGECINGNTNPPSCIKPTYKEN